MKITNSIKKIMLSLIISFFSINLGIGVANAAMKNTKDYYYGDPINQTVVTLNTSFGNEVIPSNLIIDAIDSINKDAAVIIGPYILSDFKDKYEEEVLAFFVNNKFKDIPNLKSGKFFNKESFINGNHIMLGSNISKFYNNIDINTTVNIRDTNYVIDGITFSNFHKNRINNSIIFPIKDIDNIIKKPYTLKEPFYLEVIVNGKNSKEYAEKFVNKLIELKGNYKVNIDYRTFTSDYKESVNPSSYIITGFSILILVLTIINIILLSNLLIEENYRNFAIMKSIGSYENMIALEFIKKLIYIIISSATIGYLLFVIISNYLSQMVGVGIYNNNINLIISIILGVLSCIISIIKPYLTIRNLELIEFLKE